MIAFHANGTGGMAMEELAREGYFDGILDLATHELADELKEDTARVSAPKGSAFPGSNGPPPRRPRGP